MAALSGDALRGDADAVRPFRSPARRVLRKRELAENAVHRNAAEATELERVTLPAKQRTLEALRRLRQLLETASRRSA